MNSGLFTADLETHCFLQFGHEPLGVPGFQLGGQGGGGRGGRLAPQEAPQAPRQA